MMTLLIIIILILCWQWVVLIIDLLLIGIVAAINAFIALTKGKNLQ